jgi:acyl dehydratase
MRYFEDASIGSTATFGGYDVTKPDIVEFARTYDPQPFHIDEEAAAESMFGGLVASGWHTMAMCMRMITDRPDPLAGLAGVGADNVRWHEPVRPGDHLHLRAETVDKRPSDTHDDRGYVTTEFEGINGEGTVVVSYETTAIVKRRGYDGET